MIALSADVMSGISAALEVGIPTRTGSECLYETHQKSSIYPSSRTVVPNVDTSDSTMLFKYAIG